MADTHIFDAVILGAGAAGMMCAATAGQRGRNVLLIDHAPKPGRKILISGGGRCNFTNIDTRPDRYLSSNPHFAKSALSRYTPQDFIALVERYRIAWHEKTLGQLFCDGSAQQIIDMLIAECEEGNVTPAFGQAISAVEHKDGQFHISCGGHDFAAPALVIATGGPSIPKMGATGFAYDLARQFGLKVVQPRPALVPFTLGPDEALFCALSGVSTPVQVRCGKTQFKEAALFTHKGLSGPAMLQISSYWQHGEAIHVNLLPEQTKEWLLDLKREAPNTLLRVALAFHLPARLAEALCEKLDETRQLGALPDKALRSISERLSDWPFTPNGTEGFAKAEVTAGGISTDGLSSKTMAAKHVPGLHVIGEAVDVTGWLGGYNFQWAWASAFAAGNAI